MLIAKGRNVRFLMKEGGTVHGVGAMLHDPDGRAWPKCSLLVMPFRKTSQRATEDQMDGDAKHYLGRTYEGRLGSVSLPPKALGGWDRVGLVEEIQYFRTGVKAPGGFFHPFGKRGFWGRLFKKGKLPTLYKRGNACRLELHSGCIVDDRGIAFP